MATYLDRYLDQKGPACFSVKNPYDIPISLFANKEVPIEVEAIEQLLRVAGIQETAQRIWEKEPSFWGERPGKIDRIVLTPDFHYGPIPIGTVIESDGFIIPQAPGNDICCGMRLLATDITRDEIAPHLDKLMKILRGIFFQGKREVLMSPRQRESLLRDGLWGLLESSSDNKGKGIWKYYDSSTQNDDLLRVHFQGMLPTKDIFVFDDYIRQSGMVDSRDSSIGAVGGGNHFCEVQCVDDVMEKSVAHKWGLRKGCLTIMVHTGSLGLGHQVGGYFKNQAIDIFPKSMKRPDNGLFLLPTHGDNGGVAERYLDAMNNAANFAFGNRLFIGLMATRALSEVLGREVGSKLVYDAPHNLIWTNENGAEKHVHRKGACPAPGISEQFSEGTPVLIPGSMASSSFVLAGLGNANALSSACHGAGRTISRGKARSYDEGSFVEELQKLRVVTPIDPESAEFRMRQDIAKKYYAEIKEESGFCYKDITPVIDTVEECGIAKTVVRLSPLLTVKG